MPRTKAISDTKLLERVREILLERGLGVSSKAIAGQAGVSDALLFQRFGDKQTLVFKALDIEGLALPDFDALFDAGADVRVNLRSLMIGVWHYLRLVVPSQQLLMSHPDFDIKDWMVRHDRAPVTQIPKVLEAFLRVGHALGGLNAPDPKATADLLVAVLHSRVTFESFGVRQVDTGDGSEEAYLEGVLSVLWDGLSPGAAEQSGE